MRRWCTGGIADDREAASSKAVDVPTSPMPDFIALDVQAEAEMLARDIRIELKRGSATAVVHWPVESASWCPRTLPPSSRYWRATTRASPTGRTFPSTAASWRERAAAAVAWPARERASHHFTRTPSEPLTELFTFASPPEAHSLPSSP
jgi:hypothetical protein